MKITRRAIKADTLADGRQVSEGSLRLDVIENKLQDMIGKPVSQAANFLAKYGFENTELNGQDGYRKTSGIDSYDTWAGYENNEGYYVKLYYTMERDHKHGAGNRFTWGILTDFHVDKYDVNASVKTKKKSIKASILSEYDDIRRQIGENKYQKVLKFLDDHPEYDLSDVYYKQSVWEQMEQEQGIKASRSIKSASAIMAGAGAGYNIEWSLNKITSVKSFTPISTEIDSYGDVIVDAECDVEADITINSAHSYYEGASDLDLETTAKISRIAIEVYVSDDETPEDVIANIPHMNAQELDSILYSMGATTGGDSHSGEWKSSLGGGWTHSTFNGVIADADDPHSVIDGFDGWTVTLTDPEVIDYIDKVVTGDDVYVGYALYDQDNDFIDKFNSLMDAQNKAEELIATGDYDSIECVREETKIYFDGTSEEIYNETEFVIDEPADI